MNQLTKSEQNEPMMMTFGRIRIIVRGLSISRSTDVDIKRLQELTEKFNKDLTRAKIEENHFKI